MLPGNHSYDYLRAMERLVTVIQDLSLARDLETITTIVRGAARELTGADGATFVLREGEFCHYVDEDAIAPLWKGSRFPIDACVSGWSMKTREPAIIEDIYADARVPATAYRPTFVKSMVMVPIREAAPIGAIGNYWAVTHRANEGEVRILQALANSTSIAMENVQLYTELERRVRERTEQLEQANHELESFTWSASHDLRAPLRAITGFQRILKDEHAQQLDTAGLRYLERIAGAAERMSILIDDLLALARMARAEMRPARVDFSGLLRTVADELATTHPEHVFDVRIQDDVNVVGDVRLLRYALENLLGNAWKFTRGSAAVVEFRASEQDGETVYSVRDNGVGFDAAHANEVFEPFRRLHSADAFPGTGIGLATVQRIIRRHGGRIWADAAPGHGATFSFTLGPSMSRTRPTDPLPG
jgi:hypothetical protein